MEAYEILLYPEGVDPSTETIYKRELMITMMMRSGDISSFGYGDVPSRISTELMRGKIIYDSVFEHAGPIYTIMFEYFDTLNSQDKRRILSCIREIHNLYGDEIAYEFNKEDNHLDDILNSYLNLKVDLDTVSPDISEEVERLTNMTEEEFAKEIEKEFGEEDEEETPSHRLYEYQGYMTDEIGEPSQCPPIAISEPVDTTGFQPLTEPVRVNDISDEELKSIAPDTSKYDPEYDIPDEKLYHKYDD